MSALKTIDFMKIRHVTVICSVVLILISLGSLAFRGLNFGLDFTGGTLVEVTFSKAPDPQNVREILAASGYPGANVVQFGSDSDLLIRMQNDDTAVDEQGATVNVGEKITASLNAKGLDATLQRSEIMGSQVGDELINDGGLGLLAAFAAVFLYVAVRFQTKFSIAAIAALIHDVIIVLGFFSVFQFEVDLTVLAAVLAIIGYSINDTIVVADRIRENFRRMRDVTTVELFNVSLTETLGRTIMTSGTTLLTVIALFLFGGDLIHNFSSALLVGITVGTYSSVYISAAILLWLNVSKEDLMPPEKEGAELDQTP